MEFRSFNFSVLWKIYDTDKRHRHEIKKKKNTYVHLDSTVRDLPIKNIQNP